MVPTDRSGDLDEPHAGFRQATSQDALTAEAIGRQARADAVEFEDRLGLGAHVEHFGNDILHPKRELERFDRTFDLGVIRVALELMQIDVPHQVELCPLEVARDVAVPEIPHRRPRLFILAQHRGVKPGNLVAADLGPLANCGQEGAAVVPRPAVVRRRVQRDEAGQVGVLAPQAVERPGTDRRAHELEAAAMHLREGLRVIRQVGVHAADDAQLVGLLGQQGKHLRNPEPRLAVLGELEGGAEQPGPAAVAPDGRGLARSLVQRGLVVEQVDMRRPAVHAQEDDALGPCGEMRRLGAERRRRCVRRRLSPRHREPGRRTPGNRTRRRTISRRRRRETSAGGRQPGCLVAMSEEIPNRGFGIRRSTAETGSRRQGAVDAVSRRLRRASFPARRRMRPSSSRRRPARD